MFQKIPAITPENLKKQSQNELTKQSENTLKLCNDNVAKAELALMIRQCFDGLKLYGKSPETLTNTIGLFSLVLGDFTMKQIRDAFAFYLQTSNEMPTPADIATIIRRGNKPAFDKQVYGMILKKRGEDITPEEWQYKREYEKFMTEGF